jgi:hypothetical protein
MSYYLMLLICRESDLPSSQQLKFMNLQVQMFVFDLKMQGLLQDPVQL